ncbi:MAG: cytochrome B [Rhodospirillaceae bacterium]|nr:cytochrome B [Rhodospirillaceae bacterium]
MIKNLYDWILRMAEHRLSAPILCLIAFSESIFFPIPPDVMLIPMILVKRSMAWIYAGLTTIFSSLGGLIGYFVGYFFYEKIGVLIVPENTLNQYQIHFNQYGLLIILASGFLPIIPFKLFTIASGFFDLSLGIFIIGSIISRGLRYYLIAGLLWKFGKRVRNFIETNLNLLFFIFALILIFLYLLYRMF